MDGFRYDTLQGTIGAVDLMSREIRVHVAERDLELDLDVPVVCQIIMHDERVRLRMLQAHDPVEVLYTWESGKAVAQSIEVLSPVRRAAMRRAQVFQETNY